MLKTIALKQAVKAAGLAMILIAPGVAPDLMAEEETLGSDEFRTSCASCHGVGGRGDGPMAKFLTIKPADLTKIAKNNAGQYPDMKAGQFPFYRVYQVIDGRTQVSGHGDRAMPVWGSRYMLEEGDKHGPMGGETYIRGRILELVHYVESIQQN